MDVVRLLLSAFMCLQCLVRVQGLQCWHCIADDCNEDPSDNYKATKKPCRLGHSCQKVYFEMFSENDNRGYQSTVRGCSPDCTPQNDFLNCTKQLKNSRGCIRKDCCDDSDLCNGSDVLKQSVIISVIKFWCLVFTFRYNGVLI